MHAAGAGRLARGIVEAMPEGATHKQGFFVVDKLLAMGEPADMLPLAVKIFPTGPQLTANIYGPDSWRGMNIMVKLVEAMVRCCPASLQLLLYSVPSHVRIYGAEREHVQGKI